MTLVFFYILSVNTNEGIPFLIATIARAGNLLSLT